MLEVGSRMKKLVLARNLVKKIDGKTENEQSIATLQLFSIILRMDRLLIQETAKSQQFYLDTAKAFP